MSTYRPPGGTKISLRVARSTFSTNVSPRSKETFASVEKSSPLVADEPSISRVKGVGNTNSLLNFKRYLMVRPSSTKSSVWRE